MHIVACDFYIQIFMLNYMGFLVYMVKIQESYVYKNQLL